MKLPYQLADCLHDDVGGKNSFMYSTMDACTGGMMRLKIAEIVPRMRLMMKQMLRKAWLAAVTARQRTRRAGAGQGITRPYDDVLVRPWGERDNLGER